jgi:hypothetical protein
VTKVRVSRTPTHHLNLVGLCASPIASRAFSYSQLHSTRPVAKLIPVSVSWNYGGAQPSGEVVEKKADGEVSVQSKRGNTIKRKGDPENPAVHIARPGNDVVKKQSELTVEEKAEGAENGEAEEANGEVESPPKTGEKRAAEDEPEGEEAPKKAKAGRGRPKKVGGAAAPKKAAEKKVEKKADDGEKKPRGRPKKEGGATSTPKAKKEKKPRTAPNGTGIGSRTRSKK